RMAYEASLKNMRDYANTISAAEEKGLNKGREEGRIEEAKKIARKLKSMGLPTEEIMSATGITESELSQL
ncbi:MAG: hypothetical protein K2K37_11820, partial [Muribaculaceae bacterium]|nr:hypothetical protein [Muribaculaceae bacterium]